MVSYIFIPMNKKESSFLGTEALGPLLFKMAMPAIIAMVVNSLYNVVDRIFVGQGVGAAAIGALSIVFPIQLLLGAIGVGVGTGAASLISRSIGAGDMHKARKTIGTGLSMLAILSVVLFAILIIFPNQILRILGATDTLLPLGREYLDVILWGVPFICFGMFGNNVLRAEGRATAAMTSLLIGAIGNIILDPIFIFVFDMGIHGAALATLISRIISCLWVMIVLQRKSFHLTLKEYRIDRKILREITLIGIAAFIQQAGMSVITILINNMLRLYGNDSHIIIYGVVQTILMFLIMPSLGIAQGFQPIAGYSFGAKNYQRLKEIIFLSLRWMFLVTLPFYLLAMLVPGVFLRMFIQNGNIIAEGIPVIRITLSILIFVPLNILASVYFQAVGHQKEALFLSLSRQMLFFLPLMFILGYIFGILGIWLAFPAADLLSCLVTGVLLRQNVGKLTHSVNSSLSGEATDTTGNSQEATKEGDNLGL